MSKENKVKYSIVVPCYNHEKYIPYFMDSILSQDYQNWELIITDDCSTDGSFGLLNSYKDERIKIFRNDVNRHLCDTMNNSFAHAKGEYICVMYTDDAMCLGKIKHDVEFMDSHEDIGVLYTNNIRIGEDNELLEKNCVMPADFTNENLLRTLYLEGNFMSIPGMVYRKECLDKIGKHNRLLCLLQDYDHHIRLLFNYKVSLSDIKTVKYRIRDGEANLSHVNDKNINHASVELPLALKQYVKEIKTANKLLEIFPDCVKYGKPQDWAVPYFLGRIAMESWINSIKFFGINLIYDFMMIPNNMELLEKEYGFLGKDFMALEKEHFIFHFPKKPKKERGIKKIKNGIKRFFKRAERIKKDFAIIDGIFPQSYPLGFRNYEITELLKSVPNSGSYTMPPTKPGKKAWFKHYYGMNKEVFLKNKEAYLGYYPENAGQLNYICKDVKYDFKLTYSYFLGETYTFLPFYKKNKIPFIFVLYPGGTFGIGNSESDGMLKEILSTRLCKGVIVTQKVTYDYLIKNKMIDKRKIHYLFYGYAQFETSDALPKKLYKKDKPTFDICFAAMKYSPQGVDKGYDLFIQAAKLMCNKYMDVKFHVLGNFDENDIDITDIKDHIVFYGCRRSDFLLDFYSKMDVCLSPNRPYKLYEGNFDGFPLGIECMFCGVALFTTDELNNNQGQMEKDELVIIKPEINDIFDKLEFYYNNPDLLYDISAKGQKKVGDILSPSDRIIKMKNLILNIICKKKKFF